MANALRRKLVIQVQDPFFSAAARNIPKYLLTDPKYGGGLVPQQEEGKAEALIPDAAEGICRSVATAAQNPRRRTNRVLPTRSNRDQASDGFGCASVIPQQPDDRTSGG